MAQYIDRTFGKFESTRPLKARRNMTLHGVEVTGGDLIYDLVPDLSTEIARRLWMTHYADYSEDYTPTAEQFTHGEGREWMDEAEGVSVTEDGGWYTLKAAWLGEDGEKVHGAEAAEARVKELREEGDTKGVTVVHSGGAWFLVSAPWLEEPVKVQGKEAAEAKAAELRAEAPLPEAGETSSEEKAAIDYTSQVAITEDDDEYLVSAPWLDAPERFTEADLADARQKELREGGPPEGWEPPAE